MKTALVLCASLMIGIVAGVSASPSKSARMLVGQTVVVGQPAADVPAGEVETQPQKLDATLQGVVGTDQPLRLVVTLRHPASLADYASLSNAGCVVEAQHPAIASATVVAPGTSLQRLAELPGVVRVAAKIEVAGNNGATQLVFAN